MIVSAIDAAELNCSAEIRVHLERKAWPDIVAHAERKFERMGMTKTEYRNGVLIFLGVQTHRFAVVGDQGIHEKVGQEFWNAVAEKMAAHFKCDEFAEGICETVQLVGEKLAAHFPPRKVDVNELPDEISFSA